MGFRVRGLGFGVWGLEFGRGVSCLRFGVRFPVNKKKRSKQCKDVCPEAKARVWLVWATFAPGRCWARSSLAGAPASLLGVRVQLSLLGVWGQLSLLAVRVQLSLLGVWGQLLLGAGQNSRQNALLGAGKRPQTFLKRFMGAPALLLGVWG